MVGSTSRSLSSLALCSILVAICSTMLLFLLLFPPSQISKISQKRRRFVLIFFLLILAASTVSSNPFQSTWRHSLFSFNPSQAHWVRAYSLSFDFLSTTTLQLQNPKYKTLKMQNLNWFLKVGCKTFKLQNPN